MKFSLPRLDARGWRKLFLYALAFVGVWLLFFFGAGLFGLKGPGAVETLKRFLGAGLPDYLALPAAVLGFLVLSTLGVPQVALYAAAVVAFGPWKGAAYSWIGTEASALVGFFAGRLFGRRLLQEKASGGVADFVDMVGRNGLVATLMVRQAPIAPVVLINTAAGATPMRVIDFALGTGIGILPKLAVTAFLTAFADTAIAKGAGGGAAGLFVFGGGLVLSGVVWAISGVFARRWIGREGGVNVASEANPDPSEGRAAP